MNRAVVFAVSTLFCATFALARPGAPAPAPGRGPQPARPAAQPPRPHAPAPRPNDSFWGRGGRNFWPGFVGGLIGGAVVSSRPAPVVVAPPPPASVVVTTPTVVATPTVVTRPVVVQSTVVTPVTQVQNVWVEGRYVDQIQANGTVVRVWQPGHYEQRTVVVQ